jgi:predicted nucleic acid-binding protein
MTSRWVVDASPLIFISNIGHEHLFAQLADEVIVPQAVAREVQAGPKPDRARQLMRQRYWKVARLSQPSDELLSWDLGAGETSVIAYVLANPGWTAILDDGAARRCAKALRVPVKGTLAIIVLAKQRGLIPSAKQLLMQLRNNGFRIDEAVVHSALAAVGES